MSGDVRLRATAGLKSARIELEPIAPFDFDLALRYLQAWPATVVEQIEGNVWRRALAIDGHDLLLTLRSLGHPQKPRLLLEAQGIVLGRDLLEQATAIVRRAFALDTDPTPFLRAVRADPVLAGVVERLRGVRPLQIIDPFEAIVWGILCQQINLAFGRRLKLALIELCTREITLDGRTFAYFPRPQDVVELEPAALRTRQFSRQKTAYIIGTAQAILGGELDFDALRHMPAPQAMAKLTGIKGVGRWTAEYMLARALGFPDEIAAADIGLRRVIANAYGLGRLASEAQVRELARRWEGWRGWAAFYWWMEGLLAPARERLTAVVNS
jgi:DNA-3-methyladenine glycosylase II